MKFISIQNFKKEQKIQSKEETNGVTSSKRISMIISEVMKCRNFFFERDCVDTKSYH